MACLITNGHIARISACETIGGISLTSTTPHKSRCFARHLSLLHLLNRRAKTMAHIFEINEDVHHQAQKPQGRGIVEQQNICTIMACLPMEADRRPRYRIKSKNEDFERVVTEEQIRRLD